LEPEHDVARFQIAMDDALPLRVFERVGNLDGEADNLIARGEHHHPCRDSGTITPFIGARFRFQW
jgi:hypothetical protein